MASSRPRPARVYKITEHGQRVGVLRINRQQPFEALPDDLGVLLAGYGHLKDLGLEEPAPALKL
jgi:hypothetical protein